MARQILPTDAELGGLDTIDRVVAWTGLPTGVWREFSNTLGRCTQLRVLATLPPQTLSDATTSTRMPLTDGTDRPLSAVKTIQVALTWRVARLAFGLVDIDPLVVDPNVVMASTSGSLGGGGGAPDPSAGGSPTKKVKMSAAVDQLDETEVELLTTADIDAAYINFREAVGAEPMPDADPTVEQITAMVTKVLKRKEAPYADFSVLTPYGRRTQKQAKARNFLLQADGTWKTVEIPGPPTYSAWAACWKIYRTVLLTIKHPANPVAHRPAEHVLTVAALEEYFNRIAELNEEFPEAWHLVMQAEDRCRGEQFDRYHRELIRAKNEGRLPINLDFDPFRPWVGVFQYAARCQEYWDRTVVRPAQTFLARGGAGKSGGMSKKEAEDSQYSEAASSAMHRAPGEGQSKAARRRHRDKNKIQALQEDHRKLKFGDAPWNQGRAWSKGQNKTQDGGGHPRKAGREFVTDREGNEICFAFSKGALGACPEPCQNQRSHLCQYCLGAHPNSQCNVKGSGKGKKGGGRK